MVTVIAMAMLDDGKAAGTAGAASVSGITNARVYAPDASSATGIANTQSHTLHCLNCSEIITWNIVASKLFSIQLGRFFWCVHCHTKILTHNILFTFFHYIYFTYCTFWTHNIYCLIGSWNHLRGILVSEVVLIQPERCFQPVHHDI